MGYQWIQAATLPATRQKPFDAQGEIDYMPDEQEALEDEEWNRDGLALPPDGFSCKSFAELYEEGALQSAGARQYGYAAKIGVLPGFVEGDPEAWRLVMEGKSEWDPRED
ncbi:hypothetical protein [Thioalkalivibrio sp. ALM2T]|uniref:hypothetical protein n=1 Tax=Thioalkalivibrio sp. ALM2T TaxID=1158184 RepID=UPI001E47E503|nr:hypothetical protein [Thioalkalivibrio sp. ALM2T]